MKNNIGTMQNNIQLNSSNSDLENKMIATSILSKSNYSPNTEYKIIPVDSDKLCLLDPVILSWIISITAIILYIVGHKIKLN